jgi:hypothetical protein
MGGSITEKGIPQDITLKALMASTQRDAKGRGYLNNHMENKLRRKEEY